MKKSFAVIGLGRFGSSIVTTLAETGHEVLAIDSNEDRVNEYMNIATHAVVANAQDESVLKSLGIRNFDTVVVAIGENLQASILVTLMVKEMKVKSVWAKALDSYHARVLEKIGADRVIHPERDMGVRIAHSLIANNFVDYFEISPDFSMAEIKVFNPKFINHTLQDLSFPKRFNVQISAIKSATGDVTIATADTIIHERDSILVVGKTQDVEYLDEILYRV
ncbi:MAG: TrkA family potassium uptake protein [Streptococcaceae bacterium]|jgi:trk system potassium uptake protein TrkA|nr:TrkA family potassium uptake protein [Streptococcaceae bacterium]